MKRIVWLLVAGLAVAVVGCRSEIADNSTDNTPNEPENGAWYRPPVGATWQWQLQPDNNGTLNTTYEVDLYDIDLVESPVEQIAALHEQGRRVICYFSAGTYESFRPDASEFEAVELGKTLDDFADERWLDIRSANVRRIVQARLDLALQKGCDCVEPDNVDAYANDSGFALTAEDQLDFNLFLAEAAHARGLCVGLKNDLDQIPALVDTFDFSVNEQCHEFNECEALTPFIDAGKPVFNAEYRADLVSNAAHRAVVCESARRLGLHTLILPLDLDDAFRFSCEP